MTRRYGWIKQEPDSRDFKLTMPVSEVTLVPPRYSMAGMMPVCYDQGSIGSCHDDKTEVLTFTGWKKFSDTTKKDKLASVDPKTSKLIFEHPTSFLRKTYVGKLITVHGKGVDFAVTPDHTMVVQKWNEAKRRLSKKYSRVKAADLGWYYGLMPFPTWEGLKSTEKYLIPGVMHKRNLEKESYPISMKWWLRFLGIYLGDGTMLKRDQCKDRESFKIQIAAKKSRKKKNFRRVFEKCGIHALELGDRFTFENKRIYLEMERLGLSGVKAPDKFVPKFVFSLPGQLIAEVVKGHADSDGHTFENGCVHHYTSSIQLANDLQRLIFLSGKRSTLKVAAKAGDMVQTADGRSITANYEAYRVACYAKDKMSVDKKSQMKEEDYKGEVFCAEVPTYHTLVTRRNGCILISGNCTGNAWAACFEFALNRLDLPNFMPSRLFIYYNERVDEGTVGTDSGAQIRTGAKVLANIGTVSETDWAYSNPYAEKPPLNVYAKAGSNKIVEYSTVAQTETDLKLALYGNLPVVFGIMVYDSFESDVVAQTGMVPMPDQLFDRLLGGHAVTLIGWDDSKQAFLVRNSWGPHWGLQGNFYLPYKYVLDNRLASDFWTISKLTENMA